MGARLCRWREVVEQWPRLGGLHHLGRTPRCRGGTCCSPQSQRCPEGANLHVYSQFDPQQPLIVPPLCCCVWLGLLQAPSSWVSQGPAPVSVRRESLESEERQAISSC